MSAREWATQRGPLRRLRPAGKPTPARGNDARVEKRTMIVLSTEHLPVEYGVEGPGRAEHVVAYELEVGWLMWVPDDPVASSAAMVPDVPPELLRIQAWARGHGADYVMFDRDADTVAALQTWRW